MRLLSDNRHDSKSLILLINYGFSFNRDTVANGRNAGTYPI